MADRACVPALIIVIAVAPVQRWLRTKGWPGWASTLVVVLAVYAIMLSLALAIIVSIARMGTELPKYAGQGSTLVNSVMAQLAKLGIGPDQIKQAASSMDIGKLAGAIGSLAGLATNFVFLIPLLLFLSVDASGMPERMAEIGAERPTVVEALARRARSAATTAVTRSGCSSGLIRPSRWRRSDEPRRRG